MEFFTEKQRIFSQTEEGKIVAEIDFEEIEKDVYNIYRTFVDDSLRGQGIAGKLMQMAVDEIGKRGGKIKASCSYAIKWLEKNKE